MDKIHRRNNLNNIKSNIIIKRDNMLFIPEKQVKKTLKKLRKEAQIEMREQSLKRRADYLQAEKKGKLDEYFEKLRKNRQYI